ncbi:MAG: hypothetical protein V1747_07235 [Candidatus Omnitrophota bacterium]
MLVLEAMKNSYLIVIVLGLFLFGLVSKGAAQEKELIPPGMELRLVGQTSIIVPEDAKIREKGGLIIVEQIDQYVARTLFEMKQQIKTLEAQQEKLNKEVEKLKTEIANKNKI